MLTRTVNSEGWSTRCSISALKSFLQHQSSPEIEYDDIPANHNFTRTSFNTYDGYTLRGYLFKPDTGGLKGTMIICHGYTEHCWNKWRYAERIGNMFDLAVLAYDQRFHGKSSKENVSTFGYMEGLDVSAAIDHVTELGLQKPIICWGESMGAMGVQIALYRDERIHAAILKSPPASISTAIDATIKHLNPILKEPATILTHRTCKLLNRCYGEDVVNLGDLLQLPPKLITAKALYVMGLHDEYGYESTKNVFRNWIGKKAEHEMPSESSSDTMLWWHSFDARHDINSEPESRVLLEKLEIDFLKTVMSDKALNAGKRIKQTQVNRIEQGLLGCEWDGSSRQSEVFKLKFNRPFQSTPILTTNIVKIDADTCNDSMFRMYCIIHDVERDGAVIEIKSWNANKFFGIQVQWMALGE